MCVGVCGCVLVECVFGLCVCECVWVSVCGCVFGCVCWCVCVCVVCVEVYNNTCIIIQTKHADIVISRSMSR